MGRPLHKMSLSDFLAWEDEQIEKHEFYQGEVFAMVGARRVHECVVSNLVVELGSALRGSPCRVYASNMKLLVADDIFASPDSLASLVSELTATQADVVYADLVYVCSNRTDSVVRSWRSGGFAVSRLRYGWMPPHPTFYLRRDLLPQVVGAVLAGHAGDERSFQSRPSNRYGLGEVAERCALQQPGSAIGGMDDGFARYCRAALCDNHRPRSVTDHANPRLCA